MYVWSVDMYVYEGVLADPPVLFQKVVSCEHLECCEYCIFEMPGWTVIISWQKNTAESNDSKLVEV